MIPSQTGACQHEDVTFRVVARDRGDGQVAVLSARCRACGAAATFDLPPAMMSENGSSAHLPFSFKSAEARCQECHKILAPGGPLAVFCGDPHSGYVSDHLVVEQAGGWARE